MYSIATNRKHSELSIQDSDYEENIVAKVSFEAFVPRTPTKQDLSKPVVLYSTRYRDLFSRFCDTQLGVNGGASVGKMKQLPSLRELLNRCSAHLRNGVFQLDYVTPLQLEAVRNFIWGDNDEVDLRVRIQRNRFRFGFNDACPAQTRCYIARRIIYIKTNDIRERKKGNINISSSLRVLVVRKTH